MAFLITLLEGGTAALYTLAAVVHLFHMFRRGFEAMARWSTRIAWLLHSVGLLVMMLLIGRAPLYTMMEFSYLFTWLLVSNLVVAEYFRKDQSAGSFLTPVIAGVLVLSAALPNNALQHFPETELPVGLIVWHVGVIMLGYGFFIASFVAGALYLFQERSLRLKRWGPLYYRLPSLETLDLWNGRFVYVGFPLLTIGTVAGLLFAQFSWETFWQSDPKVVFTVVVWLVYGGYLVMRKAMGWVGRRAAWWSIIGVLALLINYLVVNYLSRLHRFGV